MNNKFTVEEINLICIFESRSRTMHIPAHLTMHSAMN